MKVKITKGNYWYKNLVGEEFEVTVCGHGDCCKTGDFEIVNFDELKNNPLSGLTEYALGAYISKEDCIIVDDIHNDKDKLLQELCDLSMFERYTKEFKERITSYEVLLTKIAEEERKNKILLERLHLCKRDSRIAKDRLNSSLHKVCKELGKLNK